MATRDPEVLTFQKRLKDVGLLTFEPDGDFGPQTLVAALKGIESLPVVVAASRPPADSDNAMPSWMDELTPILTEFEGFRAQAYWDATGEVWTIGYGTTIMPDGTKVAKGDVVTKTRAIECMEHDVINIRKPGVEKALKVPQNDNQMAALVCLAYNIGTGGLAKSSLVKAINKGLSAAQCAALFAPWNKSGGKVLAGLVRRRAAEAKLYLKAVAVNVAELEGDDAIGVSVDSPDVA